MVGIIFMELMILKMTDDVLNVSTGAVYTFFFILFCAPIVSHLLNLSVIFFYKTNLNYKREIRCAGYFYEPDFPYCDLLNMMDFVAAVLWNFGTSVCCG